LKGEDLFKEDKGEDLFKLENYDFVNVNRSTKSGGGVGIYVVNELKYKIRFDLNSGVASSISGRGDIFIYSYSQTVKTINLKRN
jgi:hypothetical protein